MTKVGETITFSAGTVIAAVLTLLLASFPFYSDLGIPFAIALGVILVAGLTLLLALLSLRLSLLAQKRTVFQRVFGKPKLLPWSIQGSGKPGTWGRIATRIVRHPVPTLVTGLVVFGGLALRGARLHGVRFRRRHHRRPRAATRPRGTALPGPPLPAVVGQPDQPDLPFRRSGLAASGGARHRYREAEGEPAVHHRDRPAEPGGCADCPP